MTLATQTDCMPAVYLYNPGEAPDDYEDDGEMDSIDPISSAPRKCESRQGALLQTALIC